MISDTALSVLGSLLSCSGHSISKALLTVSLFIQFLSPFVQYSMLKFSRPGQFLGMPFSSSNLKYNPASAFINISSRLKANLYLSHPFLSSTGFLVALSGLQASPSGLSGQHLSKLFVMNTEPDGLLPQ